MVWKATKILLANEIVRLLFLVKYFSRYKYTKNIAGAFHGIQTQKWDAQFFNRGLFKGLAFYFLFAILALMSWLSCYLSAGVSGIEYTLVQALEVIISGGIAIHIKDTFIMIQAIFVAPTTEVKKNEDIIVV